MIAVIYKNCAEVYKSGNKISGVYKIDPDGLGGFEMFCDQQTAGGGWTVFQKRKDGLVDFFLGWDNYKRGFSDLKGEFWLGLDKIHRLTKSSSNKLRVDLEDFDGKEKRPFQSTIHLVWQTRRINTSLVWEVIQVRILKYLC